jgi:hypothetical protein
MYVYIYICTYYHKGSPTMESIHFGVLHFGMDFLPCSSVTDFCYNSVRYDTIDQSEKAWYGMVWHGMSWQNSITAFALPFAIWHLIYHVTVTL